jgi:hypothetical protein
MPAAILLEASAPLSAPTSSMLACDHVCVTEAFRLRRNVVEYQQPSLLLLPSILRGVLGASWRKREGQAHPQLVYAQPTLRLLYRSFQRSAPNLVSSRNMSGVEVDWKCR